MKCNLKEAVHKRFIQEGVELPIQVTSFKIKVPGQPSVSVNGTKLNSQAKNALRKARRGDQVAIFDIKAKKRVTSLLLLYIYVEICEYLFFIDKSIASGRI